MKFNVDKKQLLAILAIILIILVIGINSQIKEKNKPVAIINAHKITQEKLETFQKVLSIGSQNINEAIALEILIEEELLYAQAIKNNIIATEKDIQEKLNPITSSNNTEESLKIFAKEIKVPYEEIKLVIKRQITVTKYLEMELVKYNSSNMTIQNLQKEIIANIKEDSEIIKYKISTKTGIYSFQETDSDICSYNDKPIIRFFSSSNCGHCNWIEPAFLAAIKPYQENNLIHVQYWDVNSKDNILTITKESSISSIDKEDYNIYAKGRTPFFSFGCKYIRIGNAYENQKNGYQEEIKSFQNVIEVLLTK